MAEAEAKLALAETAFTLRRLIEEWERLHLLGLRQSYRRDATGRLRDLVTRGWALSNRMASAETQTDAQRAFERALEIDPESVDARIGLAEVLVSGI